MDGASASTSTSAIAIASAGTNDSANWCDSDPRYNVSVPRPLNFTYASIEIVCALIALAGNLLVLIVFARCRSLRTVTNYYVISLAIADTLVATVGVPSAISTSVGLPRDFHLCLLMNSVLMLLCTGSILSLVAVTVDRFWAIVHPLTYTVDMTKHRASVVIACCWTLAAIIGLLPVAGWYRCVPPEPRCFFMEVMDFRYLAFVYFATIICPVLFMAVVYVIIFRAVRLQVRKMSLQMLPMKCNIQQQQQHQDSRHGRPSKTLVLSSCLSASEERAAKGIAIIVALFVISWLPLYTVNTIICFYPEWNVPEGVFQGFIILSHCNSAWNPVIYAWGLRDFRSALHRLILSKSDGNEYDFHQRQQPRSSAAAAVGNGKPSS